jgi:1-deoxy-D-xylulose-5-phosphate synthase
VPTGYTQAFAEAIVKEAEHRPDLVAITAAMTGPTGLLPFQDRFPERCFDVGIAEQHAVTAAAGMAMGGLRPVVAIYSTFLNRAWDQIVYDVALHRLPVVFCIDRAGITGDDGASHHGMYDLALLTKVPGMTVLAPSSAQELHQMLHDALDLCAGPVAIRYARGQARQVADTEVGSGLRAHRLAQGDGRVCVLAIGKLVGSAERAVQMLAEHGVDVTLWDVRVAKPLDPGMIADACDHPAVITLEDGVREGGVGSLIVDEIDRLCAAEDRVPPRMDVRGLPVRFHPHGKPDQILHQLGLDAEGVVRTIRASLPD